MLTAQGYIQDVQEHFATILVPLDRTYLISKQEITTCEVRFDDGRTIRPEQRKKAYALINDIAAYTGHCQEELKEHFKYDLMAKTGCAHFSLSDCSVSIAREYISNMIDFCFQWDVPANDTRLNQTDDLGRYLYACLYYRKCAVCNKKAEIHHCEGSRVGMGFNRNKIDNFGRSAIALCRAHHMEAHQEEQAFFEKYHLFGIRFDKQLLKKLKL